MTLVYDDQSGQPGLHALVMGVGNYGGGLGAEAMMLQAAVPSAHAMAKWLYEVYASAVIPLRTLEVLLSPPAAAALPAATVDFVASAGKPAQKLKVEGAVQGLPRPQAGVAAFGANAAILNWYNRCNLHQDNAAFVYLCGHGVEIRGDAHFLYEGFQTGNPAQALGDTLNLRVFLQAMRSCLARRQLYFFDCCRDVPSWASDFTNPGGAPIADNTALLLPGTPPLKATCVWASVAGGRAGADRPDRSRLAEALLEVLRGPACDKRLGAAMPVSTSRIREAIEDLSNEGVVLPWTNQVPSLEPGDRFAFHVPPAPAVPVVVTAAAAAGHQLQVGNTVCQPMDPGRWLAWSPLGPQLVTVTSNGAVIRSEPLNVEPTLTPVTL